MDQKKRPQAKYAESGISDKAFKNMIVYGSLYVLIFCVGLYFAIFADMNF